MDLGVAEGEVEGLAADLEAAEALAAAAPAEAGKEDIPVCLRVVVKSRWKQTESDEHALALRTGYRESDRQECLSY